MDIVLGWIGSFIAHSWWFWLCFILGPMASDVWLAWRQKMFEHHIPWAFLELKVPRETTKSPAAMEQVLTQIWNLRNSPGDLKEYWWDGEVTLWNSLEIVSLAGEVHFYIRVPAFSRNLIEAAFFAFYPDLEIVEAEDYLKQYAPTIQELYRDGMTLWGTELELRKPGAYPIKSYKEFESPDEDKQYDPISAFIELLAKLESGQMAAVQILLAPVMSDHDVHEVNKYKEEIIKLRERRNEQEGHGGHGGVKSKMVFEGGLLPVMEIEQHTEEKADVGILKKAVLSRTPGETYVLEAIEENLARPMFNALIRYIYIAETPKYYFQFARRAMHGMFNQFAGENINSFRRNSLTTTRAKIWQWPHLWPRIRMEFRRQRIYYDFRHREIPPHTFFGHALMQTTFKLDFKKFRVKWGSHFDHLNVRSVATIFHPPTLQVLTGPHIKRVDSRKGGPPAGMAIFGDEDQIEQFE